MFIISTIKKLKAENQTLKQKIDELKARKTWQEFSIDELKKEIAKYKELIDLKDQTAIISHGGGETSLMIGGKRIGNIISVEIERMTAGSPAILNIGILTDKVIIRKGKTQVWKHSKTKNRPRTLEKARESITRIKRIDVTTLAD